MPMWKLENELIKKINSYPAEESDREIARKLWISRKSVAKYREDVLQALSKEDKLKQELVKTYSADELRDLLTHLQTNTAKSVEKIIGDKWHLKFALVSDTHLGNKQSAKSELSDFYKKAWDEWVEAFIHCGDLVDWTWNVYKGQMYELENVWYDEQLKTTVNDYPYYWDIKTYVVWWNHDESFLKENWANIIKNIAHLRDDIIDMWFYDARIKLNGVDINAHHGWWNMSYAKSYKPQKLIENIDTRSQPDIFASGHWHDALYMAYRNIHSFLPWAFLKQNLLAKRFNLGNTIWWWIVEIDIKEDGSSEIQMKFIQY
jgi:predicted phosphodiesterase